MNTKNPELIDRFIELRAQGWTFPRIAAELNVARSTLILWSHKHYHRIRNLRITELEALAESCKVSPRANLETVGDDLQRLRAEIAKRDLSDIPTARLFALVAHLRSEAARLNGPLHFSESTASLPKDDEQYLEPVVDWEV
jgi:hypothetical protein